MNFKNDEKNNIVRIIFSLLKRISSQCVRNQFIKNHNIDEIVY